VNAIKTKFELPKNTEFGLEFLQNGKYFVLDGMEDLEDGMTIKVSISTQVISNSSFSSSLQLSNLTRCNSTKGNNEDWWNTKPNETAQWEEKRYFRCLLRDNKENVVDDGNEYLKKLEFLIPFAFDSNRSKLSVFFFFFKKIILNQ